jgi:CRP-like cAMP-binding protein
VNNQKIQSNSKYSSFLNNSNSSQIELYGKMHAILKPYLHFKKVKKKETILMEGNTCKNIYFVQQGAVKQYYLSGGKEFIQNFFFEKNMACHFNSFLTQTASDCYLEVLEETYLLVLSYDNFQKICKTHPQFNEYLAICMARMNTQRVNLLLLSDALLRYKKFLDDEPNVLQRVPQYMVASYLGMTPETLSRIRKKLALKIPLCA